MKNLIGSQVTAYIGTNSVEGVIVAVDNEQDLITVEVYDQEKEKKIYVVPGKDVQFRA